MSRGTPRPLTQSPQPRLERIPEQNRLFKTTNTRGKHRRGAREFFLGTLPFLLALAELSGPGCVSPPSRALQVQRGFQALESLREQRGLCCFPPSRPRPRGAPAASDYSEKSTGSPRQGEPH